MKSTVARWSKLATSLRKPQYDLKSLKLNPSLYQTSVDRRKTRLHNGQTIASILQSYNEYAETRKQRDQLVAERNKLQQSLKDGSGKKSEITQHLSCLKSQIKSQEQSVQVLEQDVFAAIESIPNLISPRTKQDIEVVEYLNPHSKVAADRARDHHDIAVDLGIVDFESASLVSGTSSYYLIGQGAMLEHALISYALTKAVSKGWTMMTPPSLVRQEFTTACGFKPRDQNNEQQVYMLDNGLCLAGTAEIPLAGWAAHKTLDLGPEGVVRRVGVSRSYRAEAGARGRDTRGLYRVHEFTKVELFAWTASDERVSEGVFDELVNLQKEIISDLGLYARVLNMPPDDLGAPAYMKYDIECWMPGRAGWGELTSTSNCLDYQARRLHTKYDAGESNEFVHTLNGTATAVPRMIVAIIENFYDPNTNTVRIPEVLRQYMGVSFIGRK